MSNHKIALVPLATSEQQTPELFYKGTKANTGLFAESLIYYDTVYVHVDNAEQFADFIKLLLQQGLSYEQLIEIIENDTLKFFKTVSAHPLMTRDFFTNEPRLDIIAGFYAIEEEAIKQSDYFEKTFLDTEFLRKSFSEIPYLNQKEFDRFCQVAKTNSLTFDNQVVSSGIVDNAYEEFLDPEKHKLIIKNILNEIYRINNLGKVPDFEVRVREMNSQNIEEIAKNLDSTVVVRNFDNGEYKFYEVECKIPVNGLKDGDKYLKIFRTLPLSISGLGNIYIRSAGKMKCDLFLPNPISQIIGNKLYEINEFEISKQSLKLRSIIDELEIKVEFPDLQNLVNTNQVEFKDVLKFRKECVKFREWLQSEIDRDLDAITAYHYEFANHLNLKSEAKKYIKIFGVLGLIGFSAIAETEFKSQDTVLKELKEKISGKTIKGLFDYGAKELGSDWKPVCFGDWYKNEINNILKNHHKK